MSRAPIPPDRIVTLADGRRIGCEVTRWSRPGRQQVEGIDATICRLAYQQFVPPDGSIVTVGLYVETGEKAREPESGEVRRMADTLAAMVSEAVHELADGDPALIVDVPLESPLAGCYSKVAVRGYEASWARQVFDDRLYRK